MSQAVIRAEAHSDDHSINARFDAMPWFVLATDDAIRALARCDWGGDYPADDVAHAMADAYPSLTRLFNYLESIADDPAKKDVKGFECHIDSADALKWLRKNRGKLYRELTKPKVKTKACPRCSRELKPNVIECGACGYEYTEAQVLAAMRA